MLKSTKTPVKTGIFRGYAMWGGVYLPLAIFLLFSSALFTPCEISAQGQGGALWQPSGQNAAYTMRSIGIKTSSPLYDADVNGSLHSRTAVVDSILSCWEVMVSDILSVGNKLIVGGKISAAGISITGLAESGSILTRNIISTNVNADSLSANHISATGFSTVSINSQNYFYNGNLINIPQIQSDIQNGKTRINVLETTAAIHDSLLSNITSSQWQNNDTNIYFNSGFVGIGTPEPSEMLEINGRVKITGNAPSDSVTPPTPAPGKSIIIDGGIDRITATSGTLDFDNTNLTTTGNIQSTSITTTNITITDNIKTKSAEFDTLKVTERMQVENSLTSDTLHALKSLEVNNSLRLLRDTAEMYAEVSTNDTAVALMLQKDPSASVEIGEAAPTPAGEARAKLTVEGNTRLNGELNVSGEVHANCLRTGCLHVTGETSFDSLTVANKIKTARIIPLDGDSIISFGNGTIKFNHNTNNIFGDEAILYIQSFPEGNNHTIINYENSGNVGIGNPSPSEKLHVNGNIRASSLATGSNQMVVANADGVLTTQAIPVIPTIAPAWNLGGNSGTNTTTDFIGTTDAQDLIFKTTNIENARITAEGNVGIGTNNPSQKLHLFSELCRTSLRIESAYYGIINGCDNGTSIWDMTSESFSGKLYFSTPALSTPVMTMLNNGYVGVNTINPQYDFQIHSDNTVNWGSYVSPFGGVAPPPDPGTQVQVGVNILQLTNASTGTTSNDGLLIGTFNNEAFFALKEAGTMKFATDHLTRMTITADGNIGMGTKVPESHLHISGSGNQDISISSTSSTSNSGTEGTPYLKLFAASSNNITEAQIQFRGRLGFVKPLGSEGGEFRMVINEQGNVGIGTTSPQAAMHINKTGGALNLEGSNHVYMQFYPLGYSAGRKAWIGFGSSATPSVLSITNEVSNGTIQLLSSTTYFDGNVGIGTTSPNAKLHVEAGTSTGIISKTTHSGGFGYNIFAIVNNNDTKAIAVENSGAETFRVSGNGSAFFAANVGIGTNPSSGDKLTVAGTIKACSLKVEVLSGCDFVFENNYSLATLEKRKEGILKNKHLPYIKPAKEMELEGMDVGETMLGVLRNVEEHDLYLYEQNKKTEELLLYIKEQQKQILRLSDTVEELKKEMDGMKSKKK